MTKKTFVRLKIFLIAFLISAIGIYGIIYSLRENISYFISPSELLADPSNFTKDMKLGGLVKKDSHKQSYKFHRFIVTDGIKEVEVEYTGFVPALFKEGQGVIVEGVYDSQVKYFKARNILAKHDENYIPKGVYEEKYRPDKKGH